MAWQSLRLPPDLGTIKTLPCPGSTLSAAEAGIVGAGRVRIFMQVGLPFPYQYRESGILWAHVGSRPRNAPMRVSPVAQIALSIERAARIRCENSPDLEIDCGPAVLRSGSIMGS